MQPGNQQPNTPQTRPKKVGIVGSGLGAFMAYVVLRFRGLSAEDISVIGPTVSPLEGWLKFVRSIEQTSMRSESAAHFYPTDSPGLATVEALKNWTIKPVILNWFDKYHPTVDTIVEHVTRLVRQTSYGQSHIQTEVAAIHRHGNELHVFDTQGKRIGIFQHVIIGVGHGQLRIPEPIKRFNETYPHDKRVRHSFYVGEPIKPGQTVVVMGNGLSSATHWINYLSAHVNLVAVAPTKFIMNQPLNTPRKYFSKRGFAAYRQQQAHGRYTELMAAKRGTFPPYLKWHFKFLQARRRKQLQEIMGLVEDIMPTQPGRLRVLVRLSDGHSLQVIEADHVIASTGFQPVTTHPLWQTLIKQYNLPTIGGCVMASDTFLIPTMSQPNSIVGVIGSASEWAIPCADSFGGMKIVAHELAAQILGKESWNPLGVGKQLSRWALLMVGRKLS